MTAAMKAQSLLASNGIRASVIKTGGSRSKSGCAYGVSCACDENERAMSILEPYGMLGDVFCDHITEIIEKTVNKLHEKGKYVGIASGGYSEDIIVSSIHFL